MQTMKIAEEILILLINPLSAYKIYSVRHDFCLLGA